MQSFVLSIVSWRTLSFVVTMTLIYDTDMRLGLLTLHVTMSSINRFPPPLQHARLKVYLKRLGIWKGETPHGTRSGCALTLKWLGIDSEQITSHVGWKTDKMFKHYTSSNDMCSQQSSMNVLTRSNLPDKLKPNTDLYKDIRCGEKVLP